MGTVRFFLGLDLGQSVDPSALALTEWVESAGEWDAAHFVWHKRQTLSMRHLERAPLRTPYPEIVQRVRQIVLDPEVKGQCAVVVDATGVGQAVTDILEWSRLGCPLYKVKITGGDTERYADGCYRVPKRDLIARVQVMLQEGRLEIPSGMSQAQALVRELAEMRVKALPTGYEQFEAREGEHDDLVLAVSMACWGAVKVHPGLAGGGCRRYEFYGPGRR